MFHLYHVFQATFSTGGSILKTDRERFVITLEAERDEIPGVVRLKRALKFLLRSHGLRCLKAESATGGDVRVEIDEQVDAF